MTIRAVNLERPLAVPAFRWWHADVALISVLCLVGALLRLPSLGYKPLWVDEAVIWLIARAPSVSDVLSANAHWNSAPPLFVLWLWATGWMGNSDVAVRLLPAFAGLGSIPAVYALSRALAPSRLAASVSAGLTACAVPQLMYAQQLREYSLTVLLTALTLLAGLRWLETRGRAITVGLMVFMAADLLTQYGLVFVLVSVSTVMAWRAWREQNILRGWILPHLALVPVAGFVMLSTVRYQMSDQSVAAHLYLGSAYPGSLAPSALARFIVDGLASLVQWSLTGGQTTVVGIVLVALGCLYLPPVARALLFGPAALMVVASIAHAYPFLAARQDIALTVPVYLLAGRGISRVSAWIGRIQPQPASQAASIVAGLLLINGLVTPMRTQASNYLQSRGAEDLPVVLQVLARDQHAGDRVFVQEGGVPAFLHYACPLISCAQSLQRRGQAWLRRDWHGSPAGRVVLGQAPVDLYGYRFLPRQIRGVARRGTRTWIVFSHTSPPELQAFLAIARRYGPVRLFADSGDGAWLYRWDPGDSRA